MGQQFVDTVSPWILGIGCLAIALGFSTAGVILSRRRIANAAREGHNEVAGYLFAAIGVAYAVLLAFVVIAVHEDYSSATSAADEEASILVSLYRDALVLPEPGRTEVQTAIKDYIDVVINREWPAMRTGEQSLEARDSFNHLMGRLRKIDPQTPKQEIVYAESLRRLNDVSDRRSERMLAGRSQMPGLLWVVLVLGAFMVVGFSFLFRMDHQGIQIVVSGALSVLIALLLFLILELSFPFSGATGIGPTAFDGARQNIASIRNE